MDRETIKIITPIEKHEVVLLSYLIGKEKRKLASVFLQGGLSFDMKTQNMKGLSGSLVEEAQNLAWRTIIISIDGKKEGEDDFSIVEAVLNMRSEDYSFVVKKVDDITKDKDFEEDLKKN